MVRFTNFAVLVYIFLMLTAARPAFEPPVTVISTPLHDSAACSGAFVTYELPHTTTVPGGDEVCMFEANGGGVAINDLDNDGRLDMVLANHAGGNTILWNEGNLEFTREEMIHGDTRAVTLVDLDADGWQDIVLTRRASAPNFWRNTGQRSFEREVLPGISQPLYSINWADFDRDGDLDLVGATYDAGLLADLGQNFLMSGLGGVYYYENRRDIFRPVRLASQAQGLALLVVDLNQDKLLDFIVGNDFALPDMAWTWDEGEWKPAAPFPAMTYSTMSFDAGDINNDGRYELFAADMKPPDNAPSTQAAWEPILQSLLKNSLPGDPQIMANVLQTTGEMGYQNIAASSGVAATGWSWASKFGDLDQDGFVDLYVVNGMIEKTIFEHLPRHELVEENQVFRNTGTGQFQPAAHWGLNSSASGRGMSMADFDGDGDLDIVVNNLRAPAQLFENQLCAGSSLLVDLSWSGSLNPRAIGAELILHTNRQTYYRQIRAASGYLSGDPAQIHFGVPESETPVRLMILWPDGTTSTVDPLEVNKHLSITRLADAKP